MRKLITQLLVCFLTAILGHAQELKITASEMEGKTIRVKEYERQVVIPITLKVEDTDREVKISLKEHSLFSATIGKDFKFNQDISKPLVFNTDNKHLVTLDLIILPDTEKEEGDEETRIVFLWDDFRYSAKQRTDTIYLEILEKGRRSIFDSSNTNKLEFVQFTDFLGFQNDRPNGLLQQEFRFKWAMHRRKWELGKNGACLQLFRAFIFPDILLNRIDKSKQEVDYSYRQLLPGTSPKDSVARKLTTMDILKYTNLQIAARLVLLTLHTNHFRIQLQTGVRMFRNRPFHSDTIRTGVDSGRVTSDFRSVYSFAPNVEVYIKLLDAKENNVYMDMVVGRMWLRLKDAYYAQYDAAVTDEFNRANVLVPVSVFPKRTPSPIFYTSARLAKDWGENNSNAIFFRINYFYQTGRFNLLVRQPPPPQPPVYERTSFHNHFLQLQLGVHFSLDNLFKPKDSKKQEKPEGKESSENQI